MSRIREIPYLTCARSFFIKKSFVLFIFGRFSVNDDLNDYESDGSGDDGASELSHGRQDNGGTTITVQLSITDFFQEITVRMR